MRQPVEKSLRARAIDALARREHTRVELLRKLSTHSDDLEQINQLLDDLQTRGWLSDERYAEQRTHARQSRYGNRKIGQELREQGVAETLITATLHNLKSTELDRARSVWQKRFDTPATTPKERNQQMRFLQSRGFDMDVIYQVVNQAQSDD